MIVSKFKKIIFFCALLGGFHKSFAHYNSIPDKKIIALSDRDVIAIRQDFLISKKVAHLLWRKELRNNFFTLMAPLCKLLFDKKVSVEKVISEYPVLAPYKKKLYKIVALEEQLHATVDVLKELKSCGVLLVFASDSAHDVLDYKKTMNPELFNLFDFCYQENQKNGIQPDLQFYKGLRDAINTYACVSHANEILFVDSEKSNIDGARNADLNIVPHHFIDATTMRQDLIKKGYLV
jgi:hypothetical protein